MSCATWNPKATDRKLGKPKAQICLTKATSWTYKECPRSSSHEKSENSGGFSVSQGIHTHLRVKVGGVEGDKEEEPEAELRVWGTQPPILKSKEDRLMNWNSKSYKDRKGNRN